MPPAPLEVWIYFTRSVDKKTATCNVCHVSFTYARSTTNLWNHVTVKHPGSLESARNKVKQPSMKQFTATGSFVSLYKCTCYRYFKISNKNKIL